MNRDVTIQIRFFVIVLISIASKVCWGMPGGILHLGDFLSLVPFDYWFIV